MIEASAFSTRRLTEMRTSYAPRSLSKADLLEQRYLLAEEGRYRVYYAPLGAKPAHDAALVLVGLTPGLARATEAARLFAATPAAIRNDEPAYSALLREHVAFRGSMRTNLCAMLDVLELPQFLGVPRSEAIFDHAGHMVATTSALVYPVFTGPDLRNFSGAGKGLGEVALFRKMLEELLAPRLAAARSALIVPFGKTAASGLRYLVDAGTISKDQILEGFPHPSGANGHRKREFDEGRDRLAAALVRWFRRSRPS